MPNSLLSIESFLNLIKKDTEISDGGWGLNDDSVLPIFQYPIPLATAIDYLRKHY